MLQRMDLYRYEVKRIQNPGIIAPSRWPDFTSDFTDEARKCRRKSLEPLTKTHVAGDLHTQWDCNMA